MTQKEFAKFLFLSKKELKEYYFNKIGNTSKIGKILHELDFESNANLKEAIDEVISDTVKKLFFDEGGLNSKQKLEDLNTLLTENGSLNTNKNPIIWNYFKYLYYEIDGSKYDFTAQIDFFSSEVVNRKSIIATDIRPILKFNFDEYMTSAVVTFINAEYVFPGNTIQSVIAFVAKDHFSRRLTIGDEFGLFAGPKQIAKGKIELILNENLSKSNIR